MAKYINLPLLTMLIIHLQASQPEKKAVMNPMDRGNIPI
jgi:hypothetical protein